MNWNIAESTVAEPEQRIARRHLLLAGSVNCVREIPLPTNASRNRSCGQMIVNLRNRQPQLRFTALFARALRFGRAEFCSSTAPRCAESTDFNGQDLIWQSRSVFDTLRRGRINSKNVSRSIHSEQPASLHNCDWLVGTPESSNNEPHACESGNRNTSNNQTHDPPRECAVEECD